MQDKESQLYGLVEAWSQAFDIPVGKLREHLRDVPCVELRLHDGVPPAAAYAESDVRRACADLLPSPAELPMDESPS